MKYVILLEMPVEDTIYATEENPGLPEDVKYEIEVLETLYPEEIAIGTQENRGKKLLYGVITTDISDLVTFLGSMFEVYSLDWQIAALQSWKSEVPIVIGTEEDVEVIGMKPDVLVPYDEGIAFNYLQPRYEDEEQAVELPKAMNWTTHYQGQSAWA